MTASDRLVRVFVSSTFQDMQGERDHLMKFVFPAIRHLCQQRGVTFAEIDLRWGITESRSERRELIPILFSEIERCRPFFIGILGERYGMTPAREELPFLKEERWRWLDDLLGRRPVCSVTEMEIRHGVLNDPKRAREALFYFRDPAYCEGRGEAFREVPRPGETAAPAAERARCLGALKDEIRQSARRHDVRLSENYRNPGHLGELIERDLRQMIDRLYPDGGWRVVTDPLEREAAEQGRFAASRRGVYIRREANFRELHDHVQGYAPPLVVTGDAGSGKSALLANWTAEETRHSLENPSSLWKKLGGSFLSRPKGEDFFLVHFIGATPQSADWSYLLWRIMSELKARFQLPMELPATRKEQRIQFPEWLRQCAEKSRGRIILVIDALNQLEDREGALDLIWLPKLFPEKVRVIVSTLAGACLDEVKRRGWPVLPIEPLGRAERRQMAKEYLRTFGKELSEAQLGRLVDPDPATEHDSTSNPLFLKALLDELRHCRHSTIDERLSTYLEAGSIPDLFRRILDRFEKDYDTAERPHLVRDALTAIWASRRGLQEDELLLILGDGVTPMPRHHWAFLYNAARESFVDRGGLITFFHDGLRQAVRDKFLPDEAARREVHLRLADYCESCELNERKLAEYPWQLARGAAWERLATLLADPVFFLRAYRANPHDLRFFWSEIEQHGNIRMGDPYREVIENPAQHPSLVPDLSALLSDMGKTEEAGKLRAYLLESARRSGGDDLALVDALIDQAYQLRLVRKLNESMERLDEALEILSRHDDDGRLADCLNGKAIILMARAQFDEAVEILKRQREIAERKRDHTLLLRSLGNLSYVHGQRGERDKQVALLDQVEQLARTAENWADLATTLHNRSIICLEDKDFEGALRFARSHEELCQNRNLPAGLVLAIQFQGEILEKRGDDPAALDCFERASAEAGRMTHPLRLIELLSKRCEILKRMERFEEAGKLQDERIEILRKVENSSELVQALTDQAVIQIDRLNNVAKGVEILEELLRSLGEGQDALRLPCLIALGDARRQLQRLDEAAGSLQEARALAKKAGDISSQRQALDALFSIDREKKDAGGALEVLGELEELCAREGWKDELQAAQGNQGLILEEAGELERALAAYSRQESSCRENGNLAHGIEWSLARQAMVLDQLGRAGEAAERSRERVKICQAEASCRKNLAAALQDHARRLDRIGKTEEAAQNYQVEAQLHRDEHDANALLLSLSDLAGVYLRLERNADALAVFQEQVTLHRAAGSHEALPNCLFQQGQTLEKLGKADEALQVYRSLETHCREHRLVNGLQAALGARVRLLIESGHMDEGQALLEEQIVICRNHGLKRDLALSLRVKGVFRYRQGKLNDALTMLEEAAATAREIGDEPVLVLVLENKAAVLNELGQADAVLEALRECEKIHEGLGAPEKALGAILSQFNLLSARGRTGEALEAARSYERFALAHPKIPSDRRGIVAQQGQLLNQLGRHGEALEAHRREEEIARETGDDAGRAGALINRGVVLENMGRRDDAFDCYVEAEELSRRAGHRAFLEISLNNQGCFHQFRGRFDEALLCFGEAEALARSARDDAALYRIAMRQGEIQGLLGKPAEALRCCREAAEAARRRGAPSDVADALISLGLCQSELEDFPSSLESYREAEKTYAELGNPNGVHLAKINEADVLRRLGELDKALALAQKAELFFGESGDQRLLSAAVGNQAQVHAARGNRALARELHARELELARASGDVETLISALYYIAQSHLHRLDDGNAAAPLIEEALRLSAEKGFTGWTQKLDRLKKSRLGS